MVKSITEIFEERRGNWLERSTIPHVRIEHARALLNSGLRYFCGGDASLQLKYTYQEPGKRPETVDVYSEIADWLTDNKQKGLLCYGMCGLGKTVICGMIIPRLLLAYHLDENKCGKSTLCMSAKEIEQFLPKIKSYTNASIFIDDVGTEFPAVVYGEKKGYLFSDVVDEAEKRGHLLLISTNLPLDKFGERYGDRTMDRLKSLTRTVMFDTDEKDEYGTKISFRAKK